MEDLRLGREDGGSVVTREDGHLPPSGSRKRPREARGRWENDAGLAVSVKRAVQFNVSPGVSDGVGRGAHPGWRYGMASSSTTRDYWHKRRYS